MAKLRPKGRSRAETRPGGTTGPAAGAGARSSTGPEQARTDTAASEEERFRKSDSWAARLGGRAPEGIRALRQMFNRLLWGAWRRRDWEESWSDEIPQTHRSPWVAGWLGLLPGGGCLFNHRWRKAVWFAAIYIILFVAAVATFHRAFSNWVLGSWFGWVMISFVDGVATAARDNGQRWTPRNSLALFFLILFVVGSIVYVAPFFLSPFVKFEKVRSDVLEPTLSQGDRIFVSVVSYWFHKPQRGDVVFYNPPMYQMEQPGTIQSTTFVIDERQSFERVNGVPGDVLDRKNGGPVMLNGRPMPAEYNPMMPKGLPGQFHIVVPPGKYCVLISHPSKESFMAFGSFGGESPPPGTGGYVLIGWDKACLVSMKEIYGRAVAVFNPPTHRGWLTHAPSEK